MKRNKRVLLIAGAVLLLLLAGCSRSGPISLPDDVDRMTFYQEGGSLTTVTYTDDAKIESFLGYLTSLDLTSSKDPNNTEQLFGGGWQIRMYSGGEISGIDIVGGNYLQAPDGSWWKISAEQIAGLEQMLKETEPDDPSAQSETAEEEKMDFETIKLSETNMMAGARVYLAEKTETGVHLEYYYSLTMWNSELQEEEEIKNMIHAVDGGPELYGQVAQLASEANIKSWDGYHKSADNVLDGSGFLFQAELADGSSVSASGSNSFPDGYYILEKGLDQLCCQELLKESSFDAGEFRLTLPDSWAGQVTAVYNEGYTAFVLKNGEERFYLMGLYMYPYEMDNNSNIPLGTYEKDGDTINVYIKDLTESGSKYEALKEEQKAICDAVAADMEKIADSFEVIEKSSGLQ